MANTLTNLTHTVLADMALEAFTAALSPLNVFANDFSADAVQRGDKVKVFYTGAADAAQTFAGTYTIQDADASGLDITIDKHEFVSWGLTDKELSTQPQLNLERFARQKGFQLAKKVFQDILSVVTASNYGNTEISAGVGTKLTSTAANFDADDVVDLRTACSNSDWPEMERALILTPSYTGNLLKDASIQDASAFGSSSPIREAAIGRLAGFDVLESSLIPGNSENLTGIVAHPDAILCAMRYLQPQSSATMEDAGPATDPATGMTIGFRKWYDNDTGTMKSVLEAVYGYRTGNTAAIKRIVSS